MWDFRFPVIDIKETIHATLQLYLFWSLPNESAYIEYSSNITPVYSKPNPCSYSNNKEFSVNAGAPQPRRWSPQTKILIRVIINNSRLMYYVELNISLSNALKYHLRSTSNYVSHAHQRYHLIFLYI